ncbi:MAG: prolipoprotein diacylglyceryl transferase [Patescibacteria group bacterium]
MIPYFQFTQIEIGPIAIQVWGLLVAIGIIVGALASSHLAKKRGQDSKIIYDLTFWVIVSAFVFARLAHVFLYDPSYFAVHPLEILYVWQGGYSITGGFIGALIAGWIYLKKRKVDFLSYADTAIFGLPIGLFIGRIGCFLIHDHPGAITNFFLGVQFPDGAVRHDHGLYLSLNGLLLFLVFLVMVRCWIPLLTKGGLRGGLSARVALSKWDYMGLPLFTIVFLLWYGLVRFLLDFLRATQGAIVDARYLNLTPAQYFSIIMVVTGIYLFFKQKSRSKATK